jgi:hypothetical protein
MTIEYKGRREIPPTHPGAMIREDFMPDYGLAQHSSLSEGSNFTIHPSSFIIHPLLY